MTKSCAEGRRTSYRPRDTAGRFPGLLLAFCNQSKNHTVTKDVSAAGQVSWRKLESAPIEVVEKADEVEPQLDETLLLVLR